MPRVPSHRRARKRWTNKRADTTATAEATHFQERRQKQTAKNDSDAPYQYWKYSTFLSNEHELVLQNRLCAVILLQ